MNVIILAAGMGKRLGYMTADKPKCMVEVNGESLIHRLISQLEEYKYIFNKILIVTGYCSEVLEKHVNEKFSKEKNIKFIYNKQYATSNNIISLLKGLDKEKDDAIIFESDLILSDQIITDIMKHAEGNSTTPAAVVAKYEHWMDGTMIDISQTGYITKFIQKDEQDFENKSKLYKTVNVYYFPKEFINQYYKPFIKAYIQSGQVNEYYERVLQILTISVAQKIKAIKTSVPWYEIDDIEDLSTAASLFDTSMSAHKNMSLRYGGFWRFDKMIDFCYLVNPYFPTYKMKEEMKSMFDVLISSYPSSKKQLNILGAKMFDLNPENVFVGNGAAEIIRVVMQNFSLHNDKTILIASPTFNEYGNSVDQLHHVYKCTFLKTDIIKEIRTGKHCCVVIVNPNNPTGTYMPINEIKNIAKEAKDQDMCLVYDESFIDFSNVGTSMMKQELLEEHDNMIVIKSIGKSYGIGGLRLGVAACGCKKIAKQISHDLPIWNINSMAEFFMQIFNKYKNDYEASLRKIKSERNYVYEMLLYNHELNKAFTPQPSSGNFILCKITDGFGTAANLCNFCLSCNIMISNMSNKMMYGQYVRFAIRGHEDNMKLLSVLKNYQQIIIQNNEKHSDIGKW